MNLSLALALGLCVLVAINSAVRASGGSVHVLAVRRLGERTQALTLLAAHSVTCRFHNDDAEAALREAALRHGVSSKLALAVARVESALVHTRISGTGAMGLMQLMPATAKELGVSDPFDLRQGADGGVRYLRQLLLAYRGDVRRALAAYNAGSARVPLHGVFSPPLETRMYVSRIVSGL